MLHEKKLNVPEEAQTWLSMNSPVLIDATEARFLNAGCEVTVCGEYFDLSLDIRYRDKQGTFKLQCLFLAVVMVDPKIRPLRFDERLNNSVFAVRKTNTQLDRVVTPVVLLITKGKEVAVEYCMANGINLSVMEQDIGDCPHCVENGGG